MRIILIRHAEPDYVLDSLTEKGVREAELLRGRLQGYAFRDCYVSPLGRARETAEIAMMGRNAKIEEMPWLAEFRGRFPDRETGKLRLAWDLPPRVWTAEPMLLDKEKWADAPIFAGGNVREIWDETKAGVDEMMGRYACVVLPFCHLHGCDGISDGSVSHGVAATLLLRAILGDGTGDGGTDPGRSVLPDDKAGGCEPSGVSGGTQIHGGTLSGMLYRG